MIKAAPLKMFLTGWGPCRTPPVQVQAIVPGGEPVVVWCGPAAPLPLAPDEVDIPRPGMWLVQSMCYSCRPPSYWCERHR